MQTPDYTHIWSPEYASSVYEPAEDTFLLLDALEADLKVWLPEIVVEVGTGSGIVITALSQRFPMAQCLAVDINPMAALCAKTTARVNGCDRVDVLLDDLGRCLVHRLEGKVDLLIFNPPYVVTPSSEVGSRGIEASWAGGERGREVIDQFLPTIPKFLSPDGRCYLVTLEDNDIEDLAHVSQNDFGLSCDLVLGRRCGREKLSVLKFCVHRNTIMKQRPALVENSRGSPHS
ncbi:unnamed protein product [Cyprideis torosa]|uniref:Methyltransferase HEMK2 n=1 Tax=Cyprideis torosa TaxID=163714 RepID=A0A7R8W7B9_9CRUS|nr:unnamed protein product [Cyprideis torosa]CAG0887401.1 unnamed protein product [Cyprideis torosa]